MTEMSEMSGEEATQWEQRFRATPEFERVLAESDVSLDSADFSRDRVMAGEGKVRVVLRYSGEKDGDYVSASCVFDAESESVREATIDDGFVAGPLCGHGTIWKYRDGEVEQSRWIS